MKYMSKAQCRLRDALKNVLREVEILASLDHPFLVNLWFSFQGKAILTNNALLTAIQFTRFTQAAAQPTFRPGAGDLSQRNFHLFSYRDFSLSLVVTFAAGCCCDIERSLCFSSRMIGPHSKKSCVWLGNGSPPTFSITLHLKRAVVCFSFLTFLAFHFCCRRGGFISSDWSDAWWWSAIPSLAEGHFFRV